MGALLARLQQLPMPTIADTPPGASSAPGSRSDPVAATLQRLTKSCLAHFPRLASHHVVGLARLLAHEGCGHTPPSTWAALLQAVMKRWLSFDLTQVGAHTHACRGDWLVSQWCTTVVG